MDRALDEVFNQPGELRDYNLFSSHSALVDVCTVALRETDPRYRHFSAALITRYFAPHSP
jgi:hypothetical protein